MSIDSSFNSTGARNWDVNSSSSQPAVIVNKNDREIFVLYANNISFHAMGRSFEITVNSQIKGHFALVEITSFTKRDNFVYIYTSDNIPFKLTFYSNDEAALAVTKIDNFLNNIF